MENPVLKSGESYSEPFPVRHARVRIEGHTTDDVWQIESRRRDDPDAPWLREGKVLSANTRQTDIRGCKELLYRIVIQVSENSSCEAYVFEYAKL